VGCRFLTREKFIIKDLEKAGLLVGQEPITRAVNTHERCGTPLEFVHTTQWFVNVLDYKEELLQAGREITWYPEFMRKRFEHWVENLGWDWCVSRQRPYGVPFPVWYDENGEVVLASEDELPVDPSVDTPNGHKAGALTPELDVMDTWATSSLTPQIVLDWAEDEQLFSKRFPMSVRLQAHDIIRTWAFYTIVKAHHHHGSVPWRDVVVSGHALDPKGRKMSKSKGNTISPQEMIAKYGADAIRFWAAGTKLGEDLPFQEKDLVTAKKMITKLWNASKFAAMHLEGYDGNVPEFELELTDRWLLSKFYRMVHEASEAFEEYEYSKTKMLVEQFFWNDFCDDYLELAKNRLYNPDERGEESRLSAQFTLYTVLLGQLKLLAPIMPHISEKVYQLYFRESVGVVSLHNTRWPAVHEQFVDEEAFLAGEMLNEFLAAARKYKSDRQLSMRAEIKHAKLTVPKELKVLVEENLLDFLSTSGVVDVEISVGDAAISFEQS
jgi:valyl-tRNA synthetase